jgi:hypothetical protein
LRIPLIGGDYVAKSIIANAQRCLNLYAEKNPEDAPVPYTYYTRPGLVEAANPETIAPVRCAYRASNGSLYAVVGGFIFAVSSTFSMTAIGELDLALDTPVSMADNGVDILLVDGTTSGYTINLFTNTVGRVESDGFYGADYVQYVDTFFVLNRPGTPDMYISGSNSTTFDPLDFAAKTGSPDSIVAVQVMHREVWLIGEVATEVWYNTGAADFTFGPIAGVYIEHGCCAKYSVAKQDLSVYWLSQDQQGHLLVLEGNGYKATRISTHAIENEFSKYAVFSDAIGFTYQFEGHTFYQLTFPTADKTWVFDVSTGLWHEQSWTDENGIQHRHRANCAGFAYGKNILGDWQNGTLMFLDDSIYQDIGAPIVFLRSFPHVEKDGNRLLHRQFIADMQVGTATLTMPATAPMVSLRWSDDRGASWGNPIQQSMGAAGEYLTSIQFQRLGMARDRVYELSWSVPYKTALNGAWLGVTSAAT